MASILVLAQAISANLPMTYIYIGALILIVLALAKGLIALSQGKSQALQSALTARIAISVILFIILVLNYYYGSPD